MGNLFVTNYTDITFLDKIKNNLRECDSFSFSVSFIKKAGLVLLNNDIEAALNRGVRGRLITSTYQNFTDIESLNYFLDLSKKYENFECHLDDECFFDRANYTKIGYHSKGYLFTFENRFETIVGSSNITRFALLKNIEWDLVVDDEMIYKDALLEFDDKWEKTIELNDDAISAYSKRLYYSIERWDMDYDVFESNAKPNFMQRKALKELNRFRAVGTNKALVVAATGSGKTYLAAFDALNFNPSKLLYIVHENSILEQSLITFRNVFGTKKTYGIYGGGKKELSSDFLFATNISMCNSLDLFDSKEFDYIIVDECHRAVADSYKKIINHFEPEFLLGLTATPERMDNQDVFELFDDNVPFELRLRDAIENGLVVPFKYRGIRDKLVDYGLSSKDEAKLISQLATDKHCEFIKDQIEKNRKPNEKLRALAFCRNVQHARMMSEAMSKYYNVSYLTGKNTAGERLRAYNDLQNEESGTEILFSVDILNEGVDIPGVNMILFLRPTESSTVFIQQLGRGLRKYENKENVTILDFVGNNYKRSVQVAFALGSLADNFVMEQKLLYSLVKDDFKMLGLDKYGVDIYFDDLSKEELREWIEKENFNAIDYLKKDYYNFKKFINIGTYPNHMDYLNNDYAPDLMRFISTKIKGRKAYSYYKFLKEIGEIDYPVFINDDKSKKTKFINYLSGLLPLVRPYEFLIAKELLENKSSFELLKEKVKRKINSYDEQQFVHALKYMRENPNTFILDNNDTIYVDIEMDDEFIECTSDLIEYGLTRYKNEFGDASGFKLWNKYTMMQVQMIRCINPGYTAVGTYYGSNNDVYIFATLNKFLSDDAKLNYKDKYLDADTFQWETINNLSNKEKGRLLNSKIAYLFVRKLEEDHGITQPFIFVGTGKLTNPREQKENKTYLFDIQMDNTLPEYLQYDFEINKKS